MTTGDTIINYWLGIIGGGLYLTIVVVFVLIFSSSSPGMAWAVGIIGLITFILLVMDFIIKN